MKVYIHGSCWGGKSTVQDRASLHKTCIYKTEYSILGKDSHVQSMRPKFGQWKHVHGNFLWHTSRSRFQVPVCSLLVLWQTYCVQLAVCIVSLHSNYPWNFYLLHWLLLLLTWFYHTWYAKFSMILSVPLHIQPGSYYKPMTVSQSLL